VFQVVVLFADYLALINTRPGALAIVSNFMVNNEIIIEQIGFAPTLFTLIFGIIGFRYWMGKVAVAFCICGLIILYLFKGAGT
jgi:hypothetical protein